MRREKHDDLVMALWLANRGIPLHIEGDAYHADPHDLIIPVPQR